MKDRLRVDEPVRLMKSVPELSLPKGAVGVVQSVWFAPTHAYEVEFRPKDLDHPVRALILGEHLRREEK